MKKLIYLLVFAFAVTTLVSCGGKSEGKTALREMEKIVEHAEKNKDSFTPDEWKELVASFKENEKIANEAAKTGKLGMADRMKFIALTARWAALAGPATLLDEMMSKINEALRPEEAAADSAEQAVGVVF